MERFKSKVSMIIIKTNDIIFDIDWQGTKQLSNFKNLDLIKIYISIENKKELQH